MNETRRPREVGLMRHLFQHGRLAATLLLAGSVRTVVEEVMSWSDLTNWADHLQMLNLNPLTADFYYATDCYRFSWVCLEGRPRVRPEVDFDDLLYASKGRFAAVQLVHSV